MSAENHNEEYCHVKHGWRCPCLTCRNDRWVDSPEVDSKCCDLKGHRESCIDERPCPDYVPDDDGGMSI